MPNTLRVKRRALGGAAGAPSSLANAELAYNEQDTTLYIGEGTGGAGGSATSIRAIAGPGAFTTLGTTQTVTGNKTFSGVIEFTGSVSGIGGSGTVTSVALSLPNIFTVSGSPVTSTGTLTGALATQTPNSVFAGPSTGSTAIAPTFRALVPADIPTLNQNTTGTAANVTGTVAFANGGTGQTTQQAALNAIAGAVTSGFFLRGNGTDILMAGITANDVPTLTAAKISDFNTQVQTSRLDQMAAPTSSVSFNSQRITAVADPTSAQDAATKAYVDATRQGLDVKDSVRVATTADITLSGTQTIDGIAVIAGNRVLVKNQSTASQNGIYVVAASAWSRSADANSASNISPGLFTFVEEGTVNADSGWVLTTDGTITVDTTSLTFVQFSGAGQIIAGIGLTKTGNTLDISTVPVANGGTGQTTYTNGQLLIGNTTGNTLTKATLTAGSNVNITNGTGSITIASTDTTYTAGTGLSLTGTTFAVSTVPVANGGTGLTSAAQGSVLVANTANTYTALDGGGGTDKLLLYTGSTDTISWTNEVDGGTF